jgi:hypothetical protein
LKESRKRRKRMGRRKDKETRRQGDKEKENPFSLVSSSLCLLVSLSDSPLPKSR